MSLEVLWLFVPEVVVVLHTMHFRQHFETFCFKILKKIQFGVLSVIAYFSCVLCLHAVNLSGCRMNVSLKALLHWTVMNTLFSGALIAVPLMHAAVQLW
jgi:hypothetical protein